MSQSHLEHRARARRSVACAVITVSDTRTEETDHSGQLMKEGLTAAGHTIVHYQIVPDEPEQIRAVVEQLVGEGKCEALLFNGGTGISRRDTTFEVLDGLLEKRLPGFGEIFRLLSYQEIGSAAIHSRATAGVYRGKVIISVPGSSGAVRLALEKLILPELPHLVWEVTR
ncbi:MAG TPA: MogA/MoaB family molybdenum cofactor biosynthesis protein [Armatimonadetes bacterium]|nr:MogA/MoaB family molybdenum cofactor biosynthesis protein [Armatimonadota bacterium]